MFSTRHRLGGQKQAAQLRKERIQLGHMFWKPQNCQILWEICVLGYSYGAHNEVHKTEIHKTILKAHGRA